MKKLIRLFLLVLTAFIVISCTSPSDTPNILVVKAPKLSVELTEQNSVKLIINSQNDCNIHNYNVYRSSDNDLSTKKLINSIYGESAEYVFIDESLTQSGKYYYCVSEIIDNKESDISIKSIDFKYISISKPEELKVTCSGGTIFATWKAPLIGYAEEYSIFMKAEDDLDYYLIKNVSNTSASITCIDNPKNTDILLSSGIKELKVVARTLVGENSDFSDVVSFYYDYEQISSPKNFTVVKSDNSDQVILKWDPITNASFYKIYIYGSKLNNKYFNKKFLTSCSETEYSFNLSDIEKFGFEYNSVVVTAVGINENEGPESDIFDLDISSSNISNISFSTGSISLEWWEPDFGEVDFYNIYVATDSSSFVKIKSVEGDKNSATLSYKDTPTVDGVLSTEGRKYVYITAQNSIGQESIPLNKKSNYVNEYTVIPAISDIKCSLDESKSVIYLNWDYPEYGDANEFDIYIRGSTGPYALENYSYLKTVNSNSVALSSNDVTEDNEILDKSQTKIFFAIKAKNDVGITSSFPVYKQTTGNPNPCCVSYYIAHPAPKNLKLELNNEKQIVLTWDKVGNAESYKIWCVTSQYSRLQASDSYLSSNSNVKKIDINDKIEDNKYVLTANMTGSIFGSNNFALLFVSSVDSNGKESEISSSSKCIGNGICSIQDLSNIEFSYSNLNTFSINSYSVNYYCYKIEKGINYQMVWASDGDWDTSSSAFAGAVSVTSYYSSELQNDIDKTNSIVYSQNYGYKNPIKFTATKDEYIIIEVASRQSTIGMYKFGIYPLITEE